MSKLEGRFFGDEDAMRADTSVFIRHAMTGYGVFLSKKLEYTYPNGDKVRWVMYTTSEDQIKIAGVKFSKVMLDVSMGGLDLPAYHYILSRLRGRRP